jgi:hypothetical protein
MASPNGYLAIEASSIVDASFVATGAVDGVAVRELDASVDLSDLAATPGLTADEKTTIQDAWRLLLAEGYSSTTTRVSVDDTGFIRRIVSASHFDDGTVVTFEATYSEFGCAGTDPTAGPCEPPHVTPPTTVSTTSPTTTPAVIPSTVVITTTAVTTTKAPTGSSTSS